MNELVTYLLIFLSSIIFAFTLLDLLTKGFISAFFGAKRRGQKACLIQINSRADVYYRPGVMDGSWVIYTDRNKNKKRLDGSTAYPRRMFGLPVWETDEEKNALTGRVVKGVFGRTKEIPGYNPVAPSDNAESSPNVLVRSWEVVEGHDAVKTDNLYKRIILAPSIKNNKELIIIILCALVLVVLLYDAYTDTQTKKLVIEVLAKLPKPATVI